MLRDDENARLITEAFLVIFKVKDMSRLLPANVKGALLSFRENG
jgi:hypothetical protein